MTSVVETVKRWLTLEPMTPDAKEALALHQQGVAEQRAYWRGWHDGRQQATLAYVLTGQAGGRIRD